MEKEIINKWPNLIDALLAFYDEVNKEPTRDRKLFHSHLDKVIKAIEEDNKEWLRQ